MLWAWGQTKCPWPLHSANLPVPKSAHLKELMALISLRGWEVTASKRELKQSNFTAPPVREKIPLRRWKAKGKRRENDEDKGKGLKGRFMIHSWI